MKKVLIVLLSAAIVCGASLSAKQIRTTLYGAGEENSIVVTEEETSENVTIETGNVESDDLPDTDAEEPKERGEAEGNADEEEPEEPTEEPIADEPTEIPEEEPTEEPVLEPTEEPTLEPAVTAEPTEKPAATPKPTSKPTDMPKPTERPESTQSPDKTPKPTAKPMNTPKPTVTPKPTIKPTSTPKPTVKPEDTPKPTKSPKPTSTPKPTKTPKPTSTPKPTAKPANTPKPTAAPVEKPVAAEPSDPSKPSGWAEGEVNSAIGAGLVPEEMRGEYREAISRRGFCLLASQAISAKSGQHIASYALRNGNIQMAFTDTIETEIQSCARLGIVYGYDDGTFRPDDNITREQAAAMLMRCAKQLGMSDKTPDGVFADADKISGWAKESTDFVRANGIMAGDTNNNFMPQDGYTVEQAIATFYRMYNKL